MDRWIKDYCNPDLIGVGYSGGRLRSGTSDSFVDLRRDELPGGRVRVSAAFVVNPRLPNPAARNEWQADALDAELAKLFGNDLRVRIKV